MYSGYYTATIDEFENIEDVIYGVRKDSEFYHKWETIFNNPKPIRFLAKFDKSLSWYTFNFAIVEDTENVLYDNFAYIAMDINTVLTILRSKDSKEFVLIIS